MIYQDGVEYSGTHFWWDGDENEFMFTATWKFEKNYPEMPDYWHLIDVDLKSWNLMTPDRENELIQYVKEMMRNGGAVWCDIESEGPPSVMKEVDYS